MHKLSLTNNAAFVVGQMLSAAGVFKTPTEILRAGVLAEKVEITEPRLNDNEWCVADFGTIEITEAQRELLKAAVTALEDKLPPGKVTNSILTQLGFTE